MSFFIGFPIGIVIGCGISLIKNYISIRVGRRKQWKKTGETLRKADEQFCQTHGKLIDSIVEDMRKRRNP